jgi:hypothetical protein
MPISFAIVVNTPFGAVRAYGFFLLYLFMVKFSTYIKQRVMLMEYFVGDFVLFSEKYPADNCRSIPAGRTKTAVSAGSLRKSGCFFRNREPYRNDQKLRETVTRLDGIWFRANIAEAGNQFSTVIAVDNSHTVAQSDAVFDAKAAPAAKQPDCAFRQSNGHTGGYLTELSGRNGHRPVQAGIKIKSRRAGSGPRRQNGTGTQLFDWKIHKTPLQ